MAYVYSARWSDSLSVTSMDYFQESSSIKLARLIPTTSQRYLFAPLSLSKRPRSISNLTLGIAFQHWNLERFNVRYILDLKGDWANVHLVLNSREWLLFKVIWYFKHLADSCWNRLQRHRPHLHSVCSLKCFLVTFKSSLVSVQTRKSDSLSWSISQFWYSRVLR